MSIEGNTKVQNIEMKTLEDGRIAFIIDPTKNFGESSTGKSTTIASTGGFLDLTTGPLTGAWMTMSIGRRIPKSERKKKDSAAE